MKRAERRYENVVSAGVAAIFAVICVIAIATNDPPEFTSQYVQLVILWALFTTPWVIATRLLWRAWWARTVDTWSAMDGPARLLAAAVGVLPDDRHEWGAAMTAELAQVLGRGARWRFAAGCARVALFPPRGNLVTVLVVAVVAAACVVTAELVVGDALPAMRIFAVTFVALTSAVATMAVACSRRVRLPESGPTVVVAGVAGVAVCIALTANMVVKHPSSAGALGPAEAVVFAAVMAGCLWLVFIPPGALTTSRLARRVAVGAAWALGVGLVLVSRLALRGDLGVESGVAPYLFLAPVVILFTSSAIAAAVSRSFSVGVQAAVWSALLGTLAIFVAGLPEALHWYRIGARLIFDGERGYAIGRNLDGFIWGLVVLPVWWLPFGVIGAAVGNAWQRRRVVDGRGVLGVLA